MRSRHATHASVAPGTQVIAVLTLVALAGCTHVQLTASTLSTAGTVMAIEYRMVLDNLAEIERDPEALPSEIRIKQGTVQVSDEAGIYQLEASGAASGTFGGPRAQRTVSEQWGADAISDPVALKALQDVYRTAIGLPPLKTPGFLDVSRGTGKAERALPMAQLRRDVPTGWFGLGTQAQVPGDARYVGHSGKVWVWVLPRQVGGLSLFTLAVLFITKFGPGNTNNGGAGLMYTGGSK